MIPVYHENQDIIQIEEVESSHFSPQLHQSIEFIYITEGTLELGTGIDLFHMEKGDFAVIFPNQIHHAQVFDSGECRAIHLLAAPSYSGAYGETLVSRLAVNPVIKADQVHPNIPYALENLRHDFERIDGQPSIFEKASKSGKESDIKSIIVMSHAWVQILMTRSIPLLELRDRGDIKDQDIIYQCVAYVALHFKEPFSLDDMASDIGISKYSLSRVFSKTFHQNFNQYVNSVRLEHAAVKLSVAGESITDIYLDSGFQSQATFNRVFQEKYHVTPRQYRNERIKSL